MKTTKWIPALILITILWFGFSTYWYDCKIKNVCSPEPVVAAVEPPPVAPIIETIPSVIEEIVVTEVVPPPTPIELSTLIVNFALNSSNAELNDEQKTLLKKYVNEILSSERKVNIVGHTDDIGDSINNMHLGLKRAHAVEKFLVSEGVSESQIIVSSMGEESPIVANDSDANRSINRRVELSFAN